MARFHGKIGFVGSVETSPGVYENVATEKVYNGDLLRSSQRWESREQLNDNLRLENRVSIVADLYALENYQHIRYVEIDGEKWSVSSVEILRPRLILSVGGVYNG